MVLRGGSSDGGVQKQVRFPSVVNPMVALYECNISGTRWSFEEFHLGLFGCPVAFLVIAFGTGADEVLPAIGPAHSLGNDMVNGHRTLGSSTVLAPVTVAHYDVLAGEHDPLERNLLVVP